ncbi:MAG: hypothetical protein AAF602_23305, partial [Myxococcota bacterium]
MTPAFTITSSIGSLRLDDTRTTQLSFVVVNASEAAVSTTASVEPSDPATASWFEVAEASQTFETRETKEIVIHIAAPEAAEAGNYAMTVVLVDDDGVELARGPEVVVE